MTNLHPHWSTQQHSSKEEVEPQQQTVSRRPAALVGMGLVVLLSIGFVTGVEHLTGQVSDSAIVRITPSGLQPETVAVLPGQEIIWRNEDEKAHIIISEKICNDDDICLHTETVFPGDTIRYIVPLTMTDGLYTYTSVDKQGAIMILPTGIPTEPAVSQEPENTPVEEPTPEPEPVSDIPEVPSIPTNSESIEPPAEPAPPVTGLPTNPYTVGAVTANPIRDLSTPPLATVQNTDEDQMHAAAPYYPPAPVQYHQTFHQPETGAQHWFALLLSLLTMWFLARRFSQKAYI